MTHGFGVAIVFISQNSEVMCNSADVSKEVFHIRRTKEEAVTKIVVHVKHCLLNGFTKIVVNRPNTDVITLLLTDLSLFDSPYKIDVDFNFGKGKRFYMISNICSRITPDQQSTLIFYWLWFYILVFDISKSIWWNVSWQNAYIIEIFTKLSWTLDNVRENNQNVIEKYVCAAYDLHNRFHANDVNRLRFLLFTKSKDIKLRKLLPTRETSEFCKGQFWVPCFSIFIFVTYFLT